MVRAAFFTGLALLLNGCASLGAVPAPANTCAALYAELDQAVEQAGVRDGGEQAVSGFPYLRVNRLLASLSPQAQDGPGFDAWVSQLAALDLNARQVELRNLGRADAPQVLEQLRSCSAQNLARDRASSERREQLMAAAQVPPDYSSAARVLGLYPFAVPFLNIGIGGYNAEVRADYARSLHELPHDSKLILWQPPAAPALKPAEVARWLTHKDALGIPQLTPEQWQRLAAAHAPAWWVETESNDDLPGAPIWRGDQPALDISQHLTYFLPAYGRWQGRVVPQLVYIVWFAARPPQTTPDSYAGLLDGLVWRVTLDTDGRPLAYDTIHPCGCYHYYFPVADLQTRVKESLWKEPVLVPQTSVPAQDVAVRVESATHYVRRVVPDYAAFAAERRGYQLVSYRDLLTLPRSDGTTRSLFRPNGLICGTERLERFWLWPSGVISPGAMRQWGRHATSFVGMTHFDEPDALERVFVPVNR